MLHRKPQVECCLGVLRWELCAGVNKSGQCLLPEGSGHPRLIKHGDNTLFHHPIYCSSMQHHSAEGNSWQCAVSGCHDQCRMPQTPWTCTLHPCHPSECPISPQWHSQPKPWTAWMQQRSQIFTSGGKLLWSKRSHQWRWPSSDTPDVWAPWQGLYIAVDKLEGPWLRLWRMKEGRDLHASFQLCRLHILDQGLLVNQASNPSPGSPKH